MAQPYTAKSGWLTKQGAPRAGPPASQRAQRRSRRVSSR